MHPAKQSCLPDPWITMSLFYAAALSDQTNYFARRRELIRCLLASFQRS